MKRFLSNRGSSSVLVALVLIILVVFSVLAVTTSSASLRLSGKNTETIKAYYSLDSAGERFLNDVFRCILQSQDKAGVAVLSISEGDYGATGLPESISGMIEKTLTGLSSINAKEQYLDSLYPKLVMYFAMESILEINPGRLHNMGADYADAQIYGNESADLRFDIRKTFILEYEQCFRYLDVEIRISDPLPDKALDEICAIQQWCLWQEPFQYLNELDLWEGIPE